MKGSSAALVFLKNTVDHLKYYDPRANEKERKDLANECNIYKHVSLIGEKVGEEGLGGHYGE